MIIFCEEFSHCLKQKQTVYTILYIYGQILLVYWASDTQPQNCTETGQGNVREIFVSRHLRPHSPPNIFQDHKRLLWGLCATSTNAMFLLLHIWSWKAHRAHWAGPTPTVRTPAGCCEGLRWHLHYQCLQDCLCWQVAAVSLTCKSLERVTLLMSTGLGLKPWVPSIECWGQWNIKHKKNKTKRQQKKRKTILQYTVSYNVSKPVQYYDNHGEINSMKLPKNKKLKIQYKEKNMADKIIHNKKIYQLSFLFGHLTW